MNPGMEVLLKENLKALKLSSMISHLPSYIRQAKENHQEYEEFLFNLTEIEQQFRKENRLKKLIKESRFPLKRMMQN